MSDGPGRDPFAAPDEERPHGEPGGGASAAPVPPGPWPAPAGTPAPAPTYGPPGTAQPGQAQPGQAQSGQAQPGQAQSGYAQPGHPLPAYPLPPYPQAAYGQPAYGQPAYGQPAYGQPAYGQPAYGQPGFDQPGGGQSPYAQPGYPSPGYPVSGYPQAAAGYPVYGGAYPPYQAIAPEQRTDGLAIASLATGLGGFVVPLAAPVGVVLGIVGLARIRREGKRGKGLAIGGIVAGGLITLGWIAFIVLVVVLGANGYLDDTSYSDSSGSSTAQAPGSDANGPGSYQLRHDLQRGSCLDTYPATYDMHDAAVVDCGQAHGAEVLALVTLAGPVQWDSDDQPTGDVIQHAYDDCDATAQVMLGSDQFVTDVYFPDPDLWPTDAHGYCVLVSDDASLVGSAVHGGLSTSTPS